MRSSVSARQTRPRAWVAMKLIASGVMRVAASEKPPLPSRSSTTSAICPLRTASRSGRSPWPVEASGSSGFRKVGRPSTRRSAPSRSSLTSTIDSGIRQAPGCAAARSPVRRRRRAAWAQGKHQAVNEARAQRVRRERSPALDEQALIRPWRGPAARGEATPPDRRRRGARYTSPAQALGLRAVDGASVEASALEARVQHPRRAGAAQTPGEDHAQRMPAAGQPAGEPRIVGPHGVGADQHGIDTSRSSCTRRRAAAPVIQRESPLAAAIRPSSVAASFNMTSGRPRGTCVRSPR